MKQAEIKVGSVYTNKIGTRAEVVQLFGGYVWYRCEFFAGGFHTDHCTLAKFAKIAKREVRSV